MGWTYESDSPGHDEWHEGYIVPEFGNGDRGLPISGAGIPAGHIAVERLGDNTFRTRPAGEVIGWRVLCNCYLYPNSGCTKVWASEQLWKRVPSPLQHDPNAFRIYAPDDDVLDAGVDGADLGDAAYRVWRSEHIDALDAAVAIKGAAAAVRAADDKLDQAVLNARRAGLSWAKIGDAANMSAQAAHERWAKRVGAALDARIVPPRTCRPGAGPKSGGRSCTPPVKLGRMAFADYQFEVYLQGLAGALPTLPMAYADLEAKPVRLCRHWYGPM